jgi:hypothetical protein
MTSGHNNDSFDPDTVSFGDADRFLGIYSLCFRFSMILKRCSKKNPMSYIGLWSFCGADGTANIYFRLFSFVRFNW